MTEEQYSQMILLVGELKGKIEAGFLAVTQRQDNANGRTSKLEGKTELIEIQQARSDTRMVTFGWIFGGIISVGGILFTALQYFKPHA